MTRLAAEVPHWPGARAPRASRAARWFALVALGAAAGAAAGDCPSAPERFEVPVGQGQTIAFRAVWLGIGAADWFASREVGLGTYAGDFDNPPFKTWIGGSFVGTRSRGQGCDWFYYLAETEVTRAQWQAVMQLAPPAEGGGLPMTGVKIGEVYGFLDRLTEALQGVPNRPVYAGAQAFARLPTEAEWVYAARGGQAGCANDQQGCAQPYGADLVQYEWTQRNADGQLRPVKGLKPNPLGLYDMLANASELTASLYGPEYLKGRLGHFVLCGAKSGDADDLLTASRRHEAPIASTTGLGDKVGFRPVLSTAVSRRQASDTDYAAAWQRHQDQSDPTRPDRMDRANPRDQMIEDLQGRLRDLQDQNDACKTEQYDRATKAAGPPGQAAPQEPTLTPERLTDALMTKQRREIDRLQEEVDMNRRRGDEVSRRVEEVSRRELLLLMREASFYAFRGWVALEDVAVEAGSGNAPVPPESAEDLRKSIAARRETGRRFVEHYAAVVKETHDHTS